MILLYVKIHYITLNLIFKHQPTIYASELLQLKWVFFVIATETETL